jgi:hypothetical protein
MTVITRSQAKSQAQAESQAKSQAKEEKEEKEEENNYMTSLETWYIATINRYIEASLELKKNKKWYITQLSKYSHDPIRVAQFRELHRKSHFDNVRLFDEMFFHINQYLPTLVTGTRFGSRPSHTREVYAKIIECCQFMDNTRIELEPRTETEWYALHSIKKTLAESKIIVGKLL